MHRYALVALSSFYRDCVAAVTAMITNIGNLVGAGLEFTTIETNFPTMPAVGSSAEVIGDPQRWRIKPGADHS